MVLWRLSSLLAHRSEETLTNGTGAASKPPLPCTHDTNHHPEREGTITFPPQDQSKGMRERGSAVPFSQPQQRGRQPGC